jgi:hypothetical protein
MGVGPVNKIENRQVSRVLRDEELTLVSGGFHEVDKLAARGFINPMVLRGFNPQPEPPVPALVG